MVIPGEDVPAYKTDVIQVDLKKQSGKTHCTVCGMRAARAHRARRSRSAVREDRSQESRDYNADNDTLH